MADRALDESVSEKSPKSLEELCEKIRSYFPTADLAIIEKAYAVSEKAHEGQIRRSGEPYISHPLGVAAILADLHLDLATVATGLLHDTVEDTHLTLADIEREFGKAIAELVDGVTKISKIKFRNTHEKQGENIRKMIVAMGKDVRVVLVKIADRLHNMRTLNHMAPDKQARIAQETLDIYAPLASRLGMNSVKIELEDLSFRYSRPDAYYSLAQKVAKKKKDREKYLEDTQKLLERELNVRTKIRYEVFGRPKHLYSIYKKMTNRGLEYDQVNDVLAFRVLVGSVSECYEVLGHVHALWKPIPGRFKDFIAMPKVNNYQSLHTTVIGPGGERIEIQIRTREMHLIAERGIAAHWKYKEGGRVAADSEQKFEWLRDLVSLHQQLRNPDEFLETIKSDLFESEIYVFTPKGEVRELPDGATPIDFAFAVHTDVGTHCAASRVNGKLVPLKTRLRSGDTIEIITSTHQQPSKDWLKFVVTTRAKSKIRAFVKNEERKRALELGRELLEKEFRKFGMSASKALSEKTTNLTEIVQSFGANDVEDLHVLVGYGKVTGKDVVGKFAPGQKPVDEEKKTFIQKVFQSAINKGRKSQSIIKVDGMDDMLVRFGRCCNPIPGDPIAGFITRGRGITIHRADCEKAFEVDQDRRIDVEWSVDSIPEGVERVVRVRVISQDIPGLLKHMSEAFATRGINIHNAQIRTTKDKKAICVFDVSVKDTSQLSQVIQDLQKINGIIGVARVSHA
ncbi:MAG: bifunctional (p)ppGpp synthetase/guanosine-3',5'-bis(diphosphate) 3'-pyrophosphohydrolase [Bdellovibrionaceae bacterium]|nr:bifunctional (p)ppGpp synthetase/guanosine-3',5'-bis(diphosphate) 3'-pyrophosphohydrolase [Pseudobdellovibrionaceae bacterium]